MAGPINAPSWKIEAFRLIALRSWSGPTISLTNDCLVGLSIAVITPKPNAIAKTCQGRTAPARVSAASTAANAAIPTLVSSSTLRLGYRSAIAPPYMPNSRVGMNCSAVVIPTSVALPVSVNTSQSWAIRCTQPPVLETTWPLAKSR